MEDGTLQLTQWWIQVLFILLGSGVVSTAISLFFSRHKTAAETEKTKADTRKSQVETSIGLIDELQEMLGAEREQREKLQTRVEKLEVDNRNLWEQVRIALQRVGELEAEVAKWKKRYYALLRWIREQGLTPPVEPNDQLARTDAAHHVGA